MCRGNAKKSFHFQVCEPSSKTIIGERDNLPVENSQSLVEAIHKVEFDGRFSQSPSSPLVKKNFFFFENKKSYIRLNNGVSFK